MDITSTTAMGAATPPAQSALSKLLPPMPLAYVDADEDVPRLCLGHWLISEELARASTRGPLSSSPLQIIANQEQPPFDKENEKKDAHDVTVNSSVGWAHDLHFVRAQREAWREWHRQPRYQPQGQIVDCAERSSGGLACSRKRPRPIEEEGVSNAGERLEKPCPSPGENTAVSSTSPDNMECGTLRRGSCMTDGGETSATEADSVAYATAFESSLSTMLQLELCCDVIGYPSGPSTSREETRIAQQQASQYITKTCDQMLTQLQRLKERVGESDWLIKHFNALRMVEQSDFAARLRAIEEKRQFSEQTIEQLRKAVVA